MDKEYNLTSRDLMAKYDRTIGTIYRWISIGIPHQKVLIGLREQYRFNEEEVEEWLLQNKG